MTDLILDNELAIRLGLSLGASALFSAWLALSPRRVPCFSRWLPGPVHPASRHSMCPARPATDVAGVRVDEHITGERTIGTKESEAFCRLRTHVRELMGGEARRTEEIAERELMAPEAEAT